jgi:hypothetical protein
MKGQLGLLLIAIITLTSCNECKEVKNEDIGNVFILNSSPTFKGYFYKGSDNNYAYFVSKWDVEKDRYFKIQNDKLTINENLKFNKGDKELQIDLIENGSEKFAENEFYKLYVIQAKTTNKQSVTENQVENALDGFWTDGSGPNATFTIQNGIFRNVEHNTRTKFIIHGDSVTFLDPDPKEVYTAKMHLLHDDTLIYEFNGAKTKYWRLKD